MSDELSLSLSFLSKSILTPRLRFFRQALFVILHFLMCQIQAERSRSNQIYQKDQEVGLKLNEVSYHARCFHLNLQFLSYFP